MSRFTSPDRISGTARGWLIAAVLVACAAPAFAHDADGKSRHVRSTNADLRRLAAEGPELSRKFGTLVSQLDRSDVVTYLRCAALPAGKGGQVEFLSATAHTRYIKIALNCTLPGPTLTWILGHELQHAVEIAEAAEVRDVASLRLLYRRIGFDTRGTGEQFDSRLAIEAGLLIRQQVFSRVMVPTDTVPGDLNR